jgi:hypothetical protein
VLVVESLEIVCAVRAVALSELQAGIGGDWRVQALTATALANRAPGSA